MNVHKSTEISLDQKVQTHFLKLTQEGKTRAPSSTLGIAREILKETLGITSVIGAPMNINY